MRQWTQEFATGDTDTCMNKWTFRLRQDGGDVTIESVDVQRDRQGCEGHPKTIGALVRNVPLAAIDLEALANTTCPRGKSCGQVLGECIALIRDETTETERAK